MQTVAAPSPAIVAAPRGRYLVTRRSDQEAQMTVVPPMPCRASKAVIQDAAEKYAGKIHFLPGDDLYDLVRRLGGRVRFREFATLQPRESIHVRAPDDFDLYLPFETTPARDRFTIGHELGHLLLHYPVVKKAHQGASVEMAATRYLPDNPSPDVERCEWEANWFAAAFLMPSGPFADLWREMHGDRGAVAQRFFVSRQAAENRARSLGLA
jgi:predicted transcriptional regulator